MLAFFGLLAGSGMAMAAAPESAEPAASWTCPDRVTGITGSTIANPPAGWAAQPAGQPQFLSGVMVFDGPPEQGAALKPDTASADGRRQGWLLGSLAAAPAWVSCEYGGAVRLVRSVPADARWCEARSTRASRPTSIAITVRCGTTQRPGG